MEPEPVRHVLYLELAFLCLSMRFTALNFSVKQTVQKFVLKEQLVADWKYGYNFMISHPEKHFQLAINWGDPMYPDFHHEWNCTGNKSAKVLPMNKSIYKFSKPNFMEWKPP